MGDANENLPLVEGKGGEVQQLIPVPTDDAVVGATRTGAQKDINDVLGGGAVSAEGLRSPEASWHDKGRCFLIVEDDFDASDDIRDQISGKVGEGANARVKLATNLSELEAALNALLSQDGIKILTLVLDRALPKSEGSVPKEENGSNALKQIMEAVELAKVQLEVLVGSDNPAALPEFQAICPDAVIGQVSEKNGSNVVAMLEAHWRSEIQG